MSSNAEKDEDRSEYVTLESCGNDEEPVQTVTMVDVLEEEKELEEDATAVLGASDDKNCTYLQGYVKRQALYACSTCSAEVAAGVCLACSYACHEGHDLVELYTKRNFRCDCGNSKFSSNSCKLLDKKASLNPDNSYNQNFLGKYCTCSRPYPDPDDQEPDEMIQCALCEDWFHSRHLKCEVPENEDYGEMTCGACMQDNSFLWSYYIPTQATKIEPTDEKSVVKCTDESESIQQDDCDKSTERTNESVAKQEQTEESSHNSHEVKGETSSSEEGGCLLEKFSSTVNKHCGAVFWPDGWRNRLCKCNKCQKLYETHKIEFLLDPEDTVHCYEEQGKSSQNGTTQYDRGMSALGRMDHIKQVEAIHGYNNMKTALKDYLKKFAANGKVVREEDIREFFGDMQSRKRSRTGEAPPHFCK